MQFGRTKGFLGAILVGGTLAHFAFPVQAQNVLPQKAAPQKVADFDLGRHHLISPDARFVLTANARNYALFDLFTRRKIWQRTLFPSKNRDTIQTIAISPDSQQVAVCWVRPDARPEGAGYNTNFGVFLSSKRGATRALQTASAVSGFEMPNSLRFSPDGRRLWLATSDSFLAWNVQSGKLIFHQLTDGGRDSSVPVQGFFSADCRFYFHAHGGDYSVWNTQSRKIVRRAELENLFDGDIEWSSDGWIGARDNFKTERGEVFDALTGKRLWVLPKDAWPIAFDKSRVALVENERVITIHNAQTGAILERLPRVKNTWSGQFSRDNKWLYSFEGQTAIWKTRLK